MRQSHVQSVGYAGRMGSLVALLVTSMLAGCAGHVSPPGPVIPDRPGFTDTPPVLPSGAVQLEAGFTDDRVGGTEYTSVGELLVRVGVGARSEVRLFGNSYATLARSGIPSVFGREDPKIGVKTSLYTKPDSIHSMLPNISALAGLTLPLGGSDFRGRHVQPEAKLAANWTTPTPFSIYSNLGVIRLHGSEWDDRGWLSTAVWYAVNPTVSLFGEGISTTGLRGSGFSSSAVDGGLTVLVDSRFQLDVRFGHGIGPTSSRERFLGAGLARRW